MKEIEEGKRFIVKIQRSQFPTRDKFLIYNELKNIWYETSIHKNPELNALMGRDQKAFFYAQMKAKKIEVMERATWQDW